MRLIRLKFAVLFATYLSLSTPAHAYLDPATGSIIIQAVIGVVATWIMYTRAFAARFRSYFAKFARKQPNNDAE